MNYPVPNNSLTWLCKTWLLALPIVASIAATPSALAGTHNAPPSVGGQTCPWQNPTLPVARRVAMLMHHMTLANEIDLVEGQGIHKPYVFYMAGLPHLCVPAIGLEDGPSGVGDKLANVTALPAGIALAATWDPALARRYGAVIGKEQKVKGAAVDLGPTVNIDRDPRWGRSFESLSEDPYLTAAMGTAEIEGIQSQGTMAQVKHLAAYNQETFRNTTADDVIVSQRALHEIYLPAFRDAIRDGKVASVMCGYSTVNGVDSCQNRYLLTDVLRKEWNFRGFVTSDYAAIHSTAAADAGADMEQPFATYFGQQLKQAVAGHKVSPIALDTMDERILTELFRFGLFDRTDQGSVRATATSPAHERLAVSVAEAGTVLLKNRGHVLPLKFGSGGTLAVIGPAASAAPIYGGGGSAYVIPSAPISPLEGIERYPESGSQVTYVQGLPTDAELNPIPLAVLSAPYRATGPGHSYQAELTVPYTGTYVLGITNSCHCYAAAYLSLDGRALLSNPGTPPVSTYSAAVHLQKNQKYQIKVTGATSGLLWATPSDLASSIGKAVAAARRAHTTVVVVSDDTETEAADRPDLDLPSAQNELIEAVAAANPRTVVVIDAGAPISMPWLGNVAAVIDAWYPGQANGRALADILFGKADPGGHLPVTFPASLADVPAAAPSQFPGMNGKVLYGEGIDVGYRWYNARNIKPLFPFGFGLSYTKFTFSALKVVAGPAEGVIPTVVTGRITNTGAVAGSDVAQLYLTFPPSAGEPPRELVGFQRVELAPGQSRLLRFTIMPRQTWWWHQTGWTASPGTYQISLGDSSASSGLPQLASFRMPETVGARWVEIAAPARFKQGQTASVKVTLTAGGEATLRHVRLQLTPPSGWKVTAVKLRYHPMLPGTSEQRTFMVTPPLWAADGHYQLFATADLGGHACDVARHDDACGVTKRHGGVRVELAH